MFRRPGPGNWAEEDDASDRFKTARPRFNQLEATRPFNRRANFGSNREQDEQEPIVKEWADEHRKFYEETYVKLACQQTSCSRAEAAQKAAFSAQNGGHRSNVARGKYDDAVFFLDSNIFNAFMLEEEWPSVDATKGLLVDKGAELLGFKKNGARLREDFDFPEQAPSSEMFDYCRDTRKVTIKFKNIWPSRTPEMTDLEILLKRLSVGKLKAFGRDWATMMATFRECIPYAEQAPARASIDGTRRGMSWMSIGPAKEPVAIISKTEEMADFVVKKVEDGEKMGFVCILAGGHFNNCNCASITEKNNLPYTLYSDICKPHLMGQDRDKSEAFKPASEGCLSEFMLNSSMQFAGRVSVGGTVTRHLMMRDSLACLARKGVKFFKPAFSEVDLLEKEQMLIGLAAVLDRREYGLKAKYFHMDGGVNIPGEYEFRFAEANLQARCDDIKAYGYEQWMGLDMILNNSVFCAPSRGCHTCTFCGEDVHAKNGRCLIRHLAKAHKKLTTSYFVCPTCIVVRITSWEEFETHWAEKHEAGEALEIVLSESLTHVRYAWGRALVSWIASVESLGAEVKNSLVEAANGSSENAEAVSWLGGYCEKTDEKRAEMLQMVVSERKEALPAEIMVEVVRRQREREEREAQRRAEAARELAKRKADAPDVSYTEVVSKKCKKGRARTVVMKQILLTKPQPVAGSSTAGHAASAPEEAKSQSGAGRLQDEFMEEEKPEETGDVDEALNKMESLSVDEDKERLAELAAEERGEPSKSGKAKSAAQQPKGQRAKRRSSRGRKMNWQQLEKEHLDVEDSDGDVKIEDGEIVVSGDEDGEF